jgi:4-amino-4-deoxychorismate lyase
MCQLLETIKVLNNRLTNVSYHNERLNKARAEIFAAKDQWNLSRMISIPQLDPAIIYRCRILYARQIEKVEFIPYHPRAIRKLFILIANNIDYSHKYANRQILEDLKKSMTTDPQEDILIIKNGLVTDTSFSNIAFFDGSNWITSDSPLLKGTKRSFYLQSGKISERTIHHSDIKDFEKVRLINAMLDLETGADIFQIE